MSRAKMQVSQPKISASSTRLDTCALLIQPSGLSTKKGASLEVIYA
jgi:hypothetical protein